MLRRPFGELRSYSFNRLIWPANHARHHLIEYPSLRIASVLRRHWLLRLFFPPSGFFVHLCHSLRRRAEATWTTNPCLCPSMFREFLALNIGDNPSHCLGSVRG